MAPKRGRAPSRGMEAKRVREDPTLSRLDVIVKACQSLTEVHKDYRNMLATLPKHCLGYPPDERERIQNENIEQMKETLQNVAKMREELMDESTKRRVGAEEERAVEQEALNKLQSEMFSVRAAADKLVADREELNNRIIDSREKLSELEQERHRATETVITEKQQLADLEQLANRYVQPLCEGTAQSKEDDRAADGKYAKIVNQELRSYGLEAQLLEAVSRMFSKVRDREKLTDFENKILQTVWGEVEKKIESMRSGVTQCETKLEEAGKNVTEAEAAPDEYNKEINAKAEEIVLLVQQLQVLQESHKRDKRKKTKLSDLILKAKGAEKQAGLKLTRAQEALTALEELKEWRHLAHAEEEGAVDDAAAHGAAAAAEGEEPEESAAAAAAAAEEGLLEEPHESPGVEVAIEGGTDVA